MKTEELIERLSAFNEWRRGAETPQPSPEDIGKWIDHACRTLDEQAGILRTLEVAAQSIANSAQILKKERDEARAQVENQRDRIGELFSALEKLTAERDEAIRQRDETNESSKFSCNFNYEEKLKAERERDEAREQVLELKAYGVEDDQTIDRLIRERDEAREVLREIQAANWRTAGELRGMARRALEGEIKNPTETQKEPKQNPKQTQPNPKQTDR